MGKKAVAWKYTKEIIEAYNKYPTLQQKHLAKLYNVSYRTMRKIISSKNGIIRSTKRHKAWENEEEIISLYQNHSIRELARMFGGSKMVITDILKANNVYLDPTKPRKHKHNILFFDEITPHSAFILGFWLADGGVFQKETSQPYVHFCQKDPEILHYIKQEMDIENPIYLAPDGISHLSISSKEIESKINKLCPFNIYDKARCARFPLVNKHIHHIIRGIFVGDGCIYQRPTGTLQMRFIVTSGSLLFIKDIQKQLICILRCSETKIRQNKQTSVYTLEYGGNIQVQKIMKWLYTDATWEGRKWRKYQKYLDNIEQRKAYMIRTQGWTGYT